MPKLQHLNLCFNDLTGAHVDDVMCCLYDVLNHVIMSGTIPSDLLANKQLTSLCLHCNAFSSGHSDGRHDVHDNDLYDCRSSGEES